MKILLTGSNGFIGGAIKKKILTMPDIELFELNESDIRERRQIWDYINDIVKKVDFILHVGAVSRTDASDINKVMELNYEFSKRLFDLAEKYNKVVIFSSSASVYGRGATDTPKNLYAWSKKVAEDYGMAHRKKFIALRYFNVFGPGETHKGKMASVACQAYLHAKLSDEPFSLLPVKALRDFVYIDDVVEANIFCIRYIDIIASGVYDVGTGFATPFESVLRALGVPFKYKDASEIPNWYQTYTCADTKKFLPGWQPKFSTYRGLIEYRKFLDN